MSTLLSAELAATCSALGYYDAKSNKYYADSNTLETVKDLIRYLRRDDETHDIRRQLGEIKVLTNDLIPLLKSYWEETDLFDVILRLLVNLTTPALMLWNETVPKDKRMRNHFLQIEDHLQSYKETFADESFWAVLSTRLSKILETSYAERGDENSLIIERILILIRNILYVPPDPSTEKRPDNDASIHDQVLWALHQSGMLDIILYITSSPNERAYYMHTLEILSFMLREQRASDLAKAALQRSETEKMRDEAELLAIRHRETNQRQQKVKMFNGARHSRFGGTYVLKSMKSISDNELIYHKPLNKLEALNFDVDKQKPKTPKNRFPVQSNGFERRSAFSIRLFLKEFCVELLNGAYNTLMHHVKDNLVRARAQAHDESYYLWALRFFMEFNRCYKFEVKLVSETMSVKTFHFVQQQMENYFDLIQTDKANVLLWSRRLHLALLAYKELLLTICVMDKSPDGSVRDSARVIKSNIFYIVEYRELVVTLLNNYSELKMSNAYLRDLIEAQHVFLKLLESFCGAGGSVVVQKKDKIKRKKRKATQEAVAGELNLERLWDEVSPQLSSVLEGNIDLSSDVVPFDAASDVPIDEQKSEAMRNVQRKLRNGEFENAISLLRAAREVWPENNCFGSSNMAPEEEFLALRDIFFADLGENDISPPGAEQPIYDENDEEEEEDGDAMYREIDFKLQDFVGRFVHPKVVRACGLALRDFETNSIYTNNCIVKLLHRIAFDCKMYVMLFQVSIFRTFQRIYANKDFPQYRELVRFATYIIRQFIKVAEVNKKVYVESLFWKKRSEAHEIEHGYGTSDKKVATSAAWSEEQEDELRRLFVEHQQRKIDEDVVDWIVNNLVDNTRSRRGVLKKLKELCLVKSAGKASRQWTEEDERSLTELYQEFRDASDPLGCIMARLQTSYPKRNITQKLLDLGLIQNRSEVRKKRTKSARGSRGATQRNPDESDDESSDEEPDIAPRPTVPRKPIKTKKKAIVVSDKRIATILINLTNAGMGEALDWVKESFSDAVEDLECDDNFEGIPLVPIMDYALNAMENADFREALKALGIVEPTDEQEIYWRIPADLAVDTIRKHIDMLQKAIDNALIIPEDVDAIITNDARTRENSLVDDDSEEEPVTNLNADQERSNDSEELRKQSKKVATRRLMDDSDDEIADDSDAEKSSNDNVEERVRKGAPRRIIDDSSDEETATNMNVEERSEDSEEKSTIIATKRVIDDAEKNTDDDVEERGRKVASRRIVDDSDEENDADEGIESEEVRKVATRRVIDDSDDEELGNGDDKREAESHSESEQPAPKRLRVISSDEED